MIALPGASRLRNEALFENDDTTSLFVVDPTLTAVEIQPGNPIELVYPLFPLAITVAMLADLNVSMAALVDGLAASQED